MMYLKPGTRVLLISKKLTIKGIVISHDDDSDTQIANIEECLLIETPVGIKYSFCGNGGLRPRAKSLRKYGKFYAKVDFEIK